MIPIMLYEFNVKNEIRETSTECNRHIFVLKPYRHNIVAVTQF